MVLLSGVKHRAYSFVTSRSRVRFLFVAPLLPLCKLNIQIQYISVLSLYYSVTLKPTEPNIPFICGTCLIKTAPLFSSK